MNTLRFLVSRLLQTLVVLVVITFITFAIFEFFPADPAQLACDKPCTPQNLALARSYMGLNDPWYQQFWNYLSGIVAGATYGSGADAIHCSAPAWDTRSACRPRSLNSLQTGCQSLCRWLWGQPCCG